MFIYKLIADRLRISCSDYHYQSCLINRLTGRPFQLPATRHYRDQGQTAITSKELITFSRQTSKVIYIVHHVYKTCLHVVIPSRVGCASLNWMRARYQDLKESHLTIRGVKTRTTSSLRRFGQCQSYTSSHNRFVSQRAMLQE